MKFCCALYQWVSGSFARAQRTQALLADGRREKGKGLNRGQMNFIISVGSVVELLQSGKVEKDGDKPWI